MSEITGTTTISNMIALVGGQDDGLAVEFKGCRYHERMAFEPRELNDANILPSRYIERFELKADKDGSKTYVLKSRVYCTGDQVIEVAA